MAASVPIWLPMPLWLGLVMVPWLAVMVPAREPALPNAMVIWSVLRPRIVPTAVTAPMVPPMPG